MIKKKKQQNLKNQINKQKGRVKSAFLILYLGGYMYDITIEINGEKFTKKNATIRDYKNLMRCSTEHKEENFLTSPKAFEDALEVVQHWFGDKFTIEDLEENCSLADVYEIYKKIESNISEVFLGVPLQEAIKKLRLFQHQKENK